MGTSKLYRRKFISNTLIWIIVSSVFSIAFFTLVQTTGSPVPWWNTDWNFRKLITINHTMVSADLASFPVSIDIIDNDLRDKTQFDGDDIVFVDAFNNTLDDEIEIFDSSSGRLVAWIRIPLLSSTQDTQLYMYYGNPEAINKHNSSAVWDSNFVMVQHLEETGGTRFDSTTNGNTGTSYGPVDKIHNGKMDGADTFNGVSGYVKVPGDFLPTSAITVELWLKPSSYSSMIWRKFVNTGPTTTRGISGSQTSKTTDRWSFGLTWDSGGKSFSTSDFVSAYTWNHLAITWNGTYCYAYRNGVKVKEGAVSGVPDWTGKPLVLGSNYYGGENFNGSIDEVRISHVARSAEWIQTSYNNQKDPAVFYTITDEEIYSYAPLVLEHPSNEATDMYTNPTLSVKVIDLGGQSMTVIFRERVFGTWMNLNIYEDVPSGGVCTAIPTHMKNLGTTYYWGVCVTNGAIWINKTFSLTTTTKVLEQKWVASNVPAGVSGVLAADVNGDGIDEVIHAGRGGVAVLNGTNGGVLWKFSDSSIGDHCQPQMADLDKDGVLEIVVPLENPSGILALHANNGTVYWRTTGLGGGIVSSPVVFDIDGNGYPTIFVASQDIHHGLQSTGRVTSLSHDGRVLHQTFAWRPCSGGLSIADTDADGEFELYMGDRYMYLNSPEYGDNDYGKGVQSFWAKNLTLRWSRPEIFCSSQIPMLADVNKDGVLEVIVGDLNGGLAVLNSTDGSTIRMSLGIPNDAPTHYQPSIYDIDGDGNLELLMADPHDTSSDDLVVWDLVKWQIDARLYIGKNFYGPQVADVTGDGVMEIIACNYRSILIIDKTYRVIDGVLGLSGEVSYGGEVRNIDGISMLGGVLNYAVVQDIDGDGYNELIVSTQSGYIYAFDTPSRRPNPRPRSEVQFYSELRLGAAEYLQPQGGPAPIISSPYPQNLATSVSLSLSELQFTVIDYQHDKMNYTVTTNPNIGSAIGINVTNGRYAVPIGNLSPFTTYIWNITVTDGTHYTNKTFTFDTESISPWWNIDWQYRKKITFDKTKVSSDLLEFPVLIDIYDGDLTSKAQPDGGDIAFIDANGDQLNHEIELYDNITGHLIAWVNVPRISAVTDTEIYMYYGNPLAENQQKPSLTWNSNYILVQHLGEFSGTRYDSTINGNNATLYGEVNNGVDGKIDGADAFNASGYLKVPGGFLPTSAITVELWLKPSSYSPTIWTKFLNTGPSYTSGLCGSQTSKTTDRWSLGLTWNSATTRFSTGDIVSGYDWIHVAVTWDGVYCYAYYNGVKVNEAAVTGTPDWAGRPLCLGSNFNGGEPFNGTIDEVRISKVALSVAWIQTSYNNQKDPKNFYNLKIEENSTSSLYQEPIVFAPSPTNKATNIAPSMSELSFNITDCQGDLMNYTVATYPNVGFDARINVTSGRFTVSVNNLQYFTTYTWTVKATDGTGWTNVTFTFTTLPSEVPIQGGPILLLGEGENIICYNQTTYDPDGDNVTNIYNWYKNDVPITNLLMPFDTNCSTTVKDYSIYSNDGLVVRGATWTSNGKVGGAYKFERGLIQIPGTSALDGGGQWSEITVEHWIYLTESQSGTRTIARIPSYELGISGNRLFASIWTVTGNSMISGLNQVTYDTQLQTNKWYHVTLTYKSGVGLTLYVNGAAVATKTGISGDIQPSGFNPLYIGWFDYFKGIIDEVRIYPKSLSPQQIYQRYIETKDGLSNSSTIVSQETKIGEVWKCEVTPNDAYQDGATKFSNPITIGFKDNFNDNSTNFTIWKTLQKNNGIVSETNNRVECTVPSGSGTAGYITKTSYDLSDCYIQVDVSNQYLCEAALAITLDGINDHFWYSSNFYAIEKHHYTETCKVKKNTTNSGTPIVLYEGNWIGSTGTLAIKIENGVIYFYEDGILRYSEPFNLGSYKCYIHFEANTWTAAYNGIDYFDNFIFLNNKPYAKDFTITPATPETSDDLIADYTFFDPDGDPESGTEIRWYKNDVLQPELNDTLIVPYSLTAKDEIWHFTVRPCDGKEFGGTQTSPHVLIQNSPPTFDSYYPLTDPTIHEGESQEFNITCSDPDGDVITVQWYLNGTPTATTDFYIFEANYTSAGTYNVTVTIYDGLDEDSHQWTMTVLDVNQPPEITSHYPLTDPDPIYVGNSQEFNITCSDPDGDSLTIQWYVNETLQETWTGNTSVVFQPDSAGTYIIKVVVSDGQDETSHQWTLTAEETSAM